MISRRTKITLIVVVALVATLAAVALAAHVLISGQDHELIKRQLASRVQALTGFELQINGPLELPYSLLPTVVLEDIVLNNPGFSGENNLLEAEELRITFEALPLLRGEILVYESSMSSVELNLEVSSDGRSNWISDATGGTIALPAKIAVHRVDADNIRLSYRNLQTGDAFTGRIDELKLQDPIFSDQIQMQVRAEIAGTPIEISGTLGSLEDILSGSAFPIDWDIDIHDVDIDVNGQIDEIEDGEIDGFVLRLAAEGDDLREIEKLFGARVPETKRFSVVTVLSILDGTLSASNIFAEFAWRGSDMELTGNILDIRDLVGIDIVARVSGDNFSDISSLIDVASLPTTETYDLSGTVQGNWPPNDASRRLHVKGLEAFLERGQHRLTLSGDVDQIPEFGGIDLKLTATGTDPSELNAMLGVDLPSMQSYRLSAALFGDADTLSARDVVFEGSAPGARLDLRGEVGRVGDLHEIDLAMLIAVAGLPSLNPYVDTRLPESEPMELSGRLTGSAPDLDLDEFALRSGESLVFGSAGLRTGERPRIVGSVSSGVVDLRSYFVAGSEEAESGAGTGKERMFSDEPFDLSYLDLFDAQFRLDNLELLASPENVLVEHATIALQHGSLTIDPLELKRTDATVNGHFVLDRQAQPQFAADLSIENVDLATFLQDVRVREVYEGRFDLALDLRSRGHSVREVMANLNGELAAFVSDARIPDTSLPLRSIDVVLSMLPWMKRREDLVVNCAIGQFDIDDGIVNVELLYLDSAQMRMVGGGTVDLHAEELDLRLSPRPRRFRILAHNIDVAVTGPLSEPRVSSIGAAKAAATLYGKYALLGPLGLLVPTERSQKHPCVGSLQEFRQLRAAED